MPRSAVSLRRPARLLTVHRAMAKKVGTHTRRDCACLGHRTRSQISTTANSKIIQKIRVGTTKNGQTSASQIISILQHSEKWQAKARMHTLPQHTSVHYFFRRCCKPHPVIALDFPRACSNDSVRVRALIATAVYEGQARAGSAYIPR